jgi:putative Mg2+ transporter-C (MgtC) family protein
MHERLFVLDCVGRLVVATAIGLAIGINRDLTGKPIGMRTLALVSLGAAIAAVSATSFADFPSHPDALSRALQGTIQGVLIGIGFIGAGVIMRDPREQTVHGLTTAATVWVTAALGMACGLAAWTEAVAGTIIAVIILIVMRWIERRWHITG